KISTRDKSTGRLKTKGRYNSGNRKLCIGTRPEYILRVFRPADLNVEGTENRYFQLFGTAKNIPVCPVQVDFASDVIGGISPAENLQAQGLNFPRGKHIIHIKFMIGRIGNDEFILYKFKNAKVYQTVERKIMVRA